MRNKCQKAGKKSKTRMIENKKKPTPSDLRLIALIDASYKIFMALIKKNCIEKHPIAMV